MASCNDFAASADVGAVFAGFRSVQSITMRFAKKVRSVSPRRRTKAASLGGNSINSDSGLGERKNRLLAVVYMQ